MKFPIPSTADLAKYAVNRAGANEANTQSLYDTATYAVGGQTQLLFFQTPKGQGGKTQADTNMESAGALPNPKRFLMRSIELLFFPTTTISTQGAAAAAATFADDVYTFAQNGWLELFIGSKSYLLEAPLGRFPPKTGINTQSSVATTVATIQNQNSYAGLSGRPYILDAPILLEPTQNFSVSLNWPTAVGLNTAAKVMCVLDGILYRLSQ